ncbi:DUF106 domain-containing protein [Halocatena salina]|uniref:DUF106 domain-containing protein n=1 Tax=Halocatena salina TaxID=2934340 RepID=A0A8U0A0J7_9EURY|nr:DUF106 domain-containing protein [Halocatena salina]UPM42625.1 DUF106 domain-containing protein [Halocatena salina]
MARAEQKVNDLLAEDSGMGEALSTVLAQADANGGTVEWSDVNGELTSGQWGRIIEKGLLQSANGNGFAVQNPETVRAALNGESESKSATGQIDDDEESSWTTYDKLAGIGALGLMVGYWFPPVLNTIGSTLHTVIAPLYQFLPFYIIVLLLAVLTGLYSTVLRSKLVDTEKMGKYQQQMRDLQERQKKARERGDDEALQRLQQEQMEAMGDQLGMFKEQFRPMVWVMLLTIPVFLWLRWMTGAGPLPSTAHVIMPFAGEVSWNDTVLIMPAWIMWYMICSFGSTQVIMKGLDLQMTPSTN